MYLCKKYYDFILLESGQHGSVGVSTVRSQKEGPGFKVALLCVR